MSAKNYGIVLGHRLADDGKASADLIARLEKTLSLYSEGVIQYIIVSGGRANRLAPFTEGEVMKDYLVRHGIAEDIIVVENQSKTTLQNAKFCKKILKTLDYDELYLITSESHFLRKYLNPRRIFRYIYRIPVKCVPARTIAE